MPRGPTPKPDEKRERRNEPTFPSVELDSDAKVAAPDLPDADSLHERTREWWAAWTSSPQAAQFLETDWQRLKMLALVVDDFFTTDDAKLRQKLIGEIRSQEAKLGGTPEDRLRLRWRMAGAKDADERVAKKASERPAAKRSRRKNDPRLEVLEGGK